MMSLHYYLGLAKKGNADASFEAAKLMYQQGYNEVLVQGQLRRAAERGSAQAARSLGLLGLGCMLLRPESDVNHFLYYDDDYETAFGWLKKASSDGDQYALFLVAKCLQLGVGTDENETKAEAIMELVIPRISFDVVMQSMFLFDSIKAHPTKHEVDKIISKDEILQLLAG